MANWIVTPAQYSIQPNTLIGFNQSVNLTISNAPGSNYILTAENFKIGGASESPSNTWTGGNVDSEVEKVVFTSNADNTVNAQVVFLPNNMFSANETVYVDIDENDSKPLVQANQRNVCLEVTFPYSTSIGSGTSAYTYTINDPDGPITAGTTINDGTASGSVVTKHSGLVTVGESTIVADITFTRASNNYFLGSDDDDPSSVSFLNLGDAYNGYYTYEITNTIGYIYGSSGDQAIISFNLKISYTPPVEYNTADESSFCSLGHTADLRFDMGDKPEGQGLTTNTIDTVSVLGIRRSTPEIDADGGIYTIEVSGNANTQYQFHLIQTESLTSSSAAKPSSKANVKPYYDSATQQFKSEKVVGKRATYTTNSIGKGYHYLNLGSTLSDIRYDIGVSPAPGVSSTIAATAPRIFSSPLSLIQRGTRTITLVPTEINTAKYGTAPTNQSDGTTAVIRRKYPVVYNDEKFTPPPRSASVVKARLSKNYAAGKTRLTVKNFDKPIYPGMIVCQPFKGNSITHKTRIARILGKGIRDGGPGGGGPGRKGPGGGGNASFNGFGPRMGNVIILDKPLAASLSKNETITFLEETPDIAPFQFTIQNGGNTLSAVTDEADKRQCLKDNKNIDIKVPAACTNTTSVGLPTKFADKVIVGAKVTGKGILPNTTVTSINRAGSAIELSAIHNVAEGTILTFSVKDTEFDMGDIELLHAQAIIQGDGTAKISGYLHVGDIKNNSNVNVPILIDRLVATT